MIKNTVAVPKRKAEATKEMTLQKIMNVYGGSAFLGLVLSSYTHPVTGIENMNFVYNRELLLSPTELKEFLLFLLVTATLYFSFLNGYFFKKTRKMVKVPELSLGIIKKGKKRERKRGAVR